MRARIYLHSVLSSFESYDRLMMSYDRLMIVFVCCRRAANALEEEQGEDDDPRESHITDRFDQHE